MTHEEPELLVADSFRVRTHPESGEVEVRSFHAHLARFKASAIEAWQSAEMQEPARAQQDVSRAIETFLADARQQIKASGVGWPRLELWGIPDGQQSVITGQQLRLSLRTLPELGRSIEARTVKLPPIDHPERKGPNIARYAKLNQGLGAEALLTDDLGQVIEGASTSLVWWRDGTLCTSEDGGRVASVTEYALRGFATSRGIRTQRGNEHPSELAGYEGWAVNALHGIRILTSIDGIRLPAPDKSRLREFETALDATWQPVIQEMS